MDVLFTAIIIITFTSTSYLLIIRFDFTIITVAFSSIINIISDSV